jgi:hypothetical protein
MFIAYFLLFDPHMLFVNILFMLRFSFNPVNHYYLTGMYAPGVAVGSNISPKNGGALGE